ncbi:MAG TPA: hypothetical protein VMG58_01035, partial [Candidatus Sulfotelmatobacter sp.]|nr:hypothetical protein [Candidatus Sulfotelmatobacter sp.]
SKEEYGAGRRCKSEEITGLCGVGTDLDLHSAAHGDKPLPTTIAEALSILPVGFPPTIILVTGNGVHAWWLFKEPLMFDSEEERTNVARLLGRFHTMLRLNAAAKGWVYDRLSDLARILRIPGTKNLKDPANPKDVLLHSQSGAYYNLSDFEDLLDDAQVPDPETQAKAAQEWKERFADKPLTINAAARIPQELLDAWMDPQQVAPRIAAMFRNTWERRRHDLKDPSQSGYDLALADFGVDAGLSEQQIVDLIMHHRSTSGQKHRKGLAYFQRTIATAQQRADYRVAMAPIVGAEGTAAKTGLAGAQAAPVAPGASQGSDTISPPPDAAPPPPPPDPAAEDRKRAALCEEISDRLDLKPPCRLLRIVMIQGKAPQYRMEFTNRMKLEIPAYSKLVDQGFVLAEIGAQIRRVMDRMKPVLWKQTAQMILDACIVEEGTDEMDWLGSMRQYLQHYLAETNFIRAIEEEPKLQDQRKPMVINGRISLIASELQAYINKTTFQNLSIPKITGALSALGAKSRRVRGPKFNSQSRWVLPGPGDHSGELDQENCFDPANYPTHEGDANVTIN